jgi:hypothetical protein
MLRLDLSQAPRWLDLGHGVRLQLMPLTTALMVAARADPDVEALPETASDEERALVFAKAIARSAILDWEGVGDADGHPVPVSPEGIGALLEVWPVFEAFQLGYVAKGLALEQEKTSPRPRRLALRRGRPLLRGLPGLVPGLPGAAEPATHEGGLAGLGPCSAPRRPAAGNPRRRSWLGHGCGARARGRAGGGRARGG